LPNPETVDEKNCKKWRKCRKTRECDDTVSEEQGCKKWRKWRKESDDKESDGEKNVKSGENGEKRMLILKLVKKNVGD